jgi:2-C-methyl-D-erythritol 4-phosphate cytidylyltransferase
MVEWSIAAFRAAPSIRSIVVACPPGHVYELAGADLGVVDGGATRAHSVSNALEAVGTELVAIHDAARPLVTPELIEGTIATLIAAPSADAAIAATPVTDTIKRVSSPLLPPGRNALTTQGGGKALRPGEQVEAPSGRNVLESHEDVKALRQVEGTVDRGRLWAAQTPQVFRVRALRSALEGDPDRLVAATDEAMLIEAAGGTVLIHPSAPENLKVTTPLDLRLAELLLTPGGAT